MLRSNSKSLGNPCSEEEKERLRKDALYLVPTEHC